jgi:FAD synthase
MARQTAKQKQTQVAVMTFDPHPEVVLRPERAPEILTPLQMKIRSNCSICRRRILWTSS